ncbi:SIS domain-containing protein [Microbacterium sp. 22215]|uniref:SIS domain-containing protein n=1 Tax=Microbacterium sp. 22215 TaxID=3453893 RepID=UPI003F8351CC
MAALLDAGTVDAVLEKLATAKTVFIAGSGLSAPVADDLAMRLAALGLRVQRVSDPMGQEIAAFTLLPENLCIAISGSGQNASTYRSVEAARSRGTDVVLLPSVDSSPTRELATLTLMVSAAGASYASEVTGIGRLPMYLFTHALCDVLRRTLDGSTQPVRAEIMAVIDRFTLFAE